MEKTMPNSGDIIAAIDKRVFLFPVCSGTLGMISVIMQIVAVATSYWAHFKRELNVETVVAGEIPTDPLYEEGHYGLWSVCLTVFDGQSLDTEDCSTNIAHFHPSSWRVFAGIIATICAVLLLLFLATIPFQMQHLRNRRPVYCKYRTLSRIKIVLNIVGIACAILAAVLFGVNTHHKHYKEPKGWSFGLQIVVVVNQVFLLISSSAENVTAIKIDNISPAPQYLFTITGRKKEFADERTNTYKHSSNNAALGNQLSRKSKIANEPSSSLNLTIGQDLSRENPIFIDSDNEIETVNEVRQENEINLTKQAALHPPSTKEVMFASGTSTLGRFRVQKIADMYTSGKEANDLDRVSHSQHSQNYIHNADLF